MIFGPMFQMILDRVKAIAHGVKNIVEDIKHDVEVEVLPFDPAKFEARMDVRAAEYEAREGQKLNWRPSLTDLLKAIGLDSSKAACAELAHEFGLFNDGKDYVGTASQNITLHARLLDALAENDARLPRLRS